MSTMGKVLMLALSVGLVAVGILFVNATDVSAGAKIVQVEGAAFNVKDTMADNIKNFKGKHVSISLTSGEKINGKVVDVNHKYLHLEKLERMDFYDAFIDISHISAVKAKFRKYSNE